MKTATCDCIDYHVAPLLCPYCSKFCSHSWDTGGIQTPNGYTHSWGGTCKTHGHWSDGI